MFQIVSSRTRQFLTSDANFKRLLINAGWLLSGNSLTLGFSFLQTILVARLLGVEQFGVLTLVTVYTTSVNQLVDSRVWETVIKFVTKYLEERDLPRATAVVKFCYLIDAFTGSLAFLILFFSATWGARLFLQNEQLAHLIQLYAVMMLIMIPSGTASALLRISSHFNWLAYQQAGVAVLKLIGTGLVLLWYGGGVREILIIYLATTALGSVGLVVMAGYVGRQLSLVTWFEAPLNLLRGQIISILRFLLMTNGGAFFKLIQRNADILLIGYWLSPAEAGYFRLARSFTDVMGLPIKPIYTASYPDFTRIWHQQRHHELKRLVKKLSVSTSAVMFVILILVWLNASWIIDFTVGPEYLPTLPALYWLALGTAMATATNIGHPLLLATGRVSKSLLAISMGVTVQLGLLIYLLPKMGIVGAGVAYVGFYVVWILIVMITVISVFQVNDQK